MQLFESLAAMPRGFGPSAVTIGKFDGVHLGHRAVIAKLREVATDDDLTTTVVTFDRHPLSLLNPERCPVALLSVRQKAELLSGIGVEATLVLKFDRALSDQSAEDFVREVLVGALNAKAVLVGHDFRFGANGGGDLELLRALGSEYGFAVHLIPEVAVGDAGRVSSTQIREYLARGLVREAATLLGREPSIRSVVVRGEARGRELGYPTANLAPDIEGMVPADGVYAAWASVDSVRYPAAVSIGNNPTFAGVPERQVEAHLLDERLDLYGRELTVSFVEFVRSMHKFASADALVAQMKLDEGAIRRILGVAASAQ